MEGSPGVWPPDSKGSILHQRSVYSSYPQFTVGDSRCKAISKIHTHTVEIEYTNLIRESRLLSEGLFSSFRGLFFKIIMLVFKYFKYQSADRICSGPLYTFAFCQPLL